MRSQIRRSVDAETEEDAIGLMFNGKRVSGRRYPWAGAYFNGGSFKCGGNLSKFLNESVFNNNEILLKIYFSYQQACYFCRSLCSFERSSRSISV